ncbi:MAG: sodium:solute symporter family transporter, partial [Planctomycetota bacterium]
MTKSATVWAVLAIYVAALALCAAWARRRTRDLADYYVGGRGVPAWILALSYFATYVSTNTFVGHAGKSYALGVSWLLLGAVLFAFSVASWRWIGPRMAEVAAADGLLTVPEFFARRLRSPAAGTIAAALILFDSVWYLTAVFQGAAASAEHLLD